MRELNPCGEGRGEGGERKRMEFRGRRGWREGRWSTFGGALQRLLERWRGWMGWSPVRQGGKREVRGPQRGWLEGGRVFRWGRRESHAEVRRRGGGKRYHAEAQREGGAERGRKRERGAGGRSREKAEERRGRGERKERKEKEFLVRQRGRRKVRGPQRGWFEAGRVFRWGRRESRVEVRRWEEGKKNHAEAQREGGAERGRKRERASGGKRRGKTEERRGRGERKDRKGLEFPKRRGWPFQGALQGGRERWQKRRRRLPGRQLGTRGERGPQRGLLGGGSRELWVEQREFREEGLRWAKWTHAVVWRGG